eukprot:TRINITY_DN4545_c0_g1_i1.p1 TRINITY_DN4545_c0_g1~~TRINITY_DN4545_c0_g1_i1.p1  ORF type:complete len:689 (-),score=121.57 TRINITY_DN4545_c0_g1_i1:111-2177(-)
MAFLTFRKFLVTFLAVAIIGGVLYMTPKKSTPVNRMLAPLTCKNRLGSETSFLDTSPKEKSVSHSITPASSAAFDVQYLWGTYKPQLIHAVSQRDVAQNQPITVGMMYHDARYLYSVDDIRYKVKERLNDNVRYDYTYHNADDFVINRVLDPNIPVDLKNTFVKLEASENRQRWVSVSEHSFEPADPMFNSSKLVSMIYTVSLENFSEGPDDKRALKADFANNSLFVEIGHGSAVQTASEFITFKIMQGGKEVDVKNFGTRFNMVSRSKADNWNVKDTVFNNIHNENGINVLRQLDPSDTSTKTLFFAQFIFPVNETFTVQIAYDNRGFPSAELNDVKKEVERHKTLFETRYKEIFPQSAGLEEHLNNCSRLSLANLLGGLAYNYGRIRVVQPEENARQKPLPLLSFTPSRFGFPRGFLWDEGFHLLIACKWNKKLCLEIMKNWLNTMNDDGWIPREQARGAEAESYMLIKEDTREGNPPALMLPIMVLASSANEDDEFEAFIRLYLPKLVTWHKWFSELQRYKGGDYRPGEPYFKWWGPSEELNYGSGMDDFPRTEWHYYTKYNTDAHVWVLVWTEIMAGLSCRYGTPNDYEYFMGQVDLMKESLRKLIDPKDHLYKDVLKDSLGVNKDIFSPHLGYPNLFPLIFGYISKDDPEFRATLDFIANEKEIWSKYGLRSLAVHDLSLIHI